MAAARAIEHYGTQAHSYTAEEFDAQYLTHFGEPAE
jgi:hypothetical protein